MLIKEIRIKNNLLQEEMADRLGVSTNYISLVENSKKRPGIEFLSKFSKEFNVPLILLTQELDLPLDLPVARTPQERAINDKISDLVRELEEFVLERA